MSDAKERLKKLLDGDLEASDIAEDASLVSLAAVSYTHLTLPTNREV